MSDELFLPDFDAGDLADIQALMQAEVPDETEATVPTTFEQPVKRRRGRPRKHPIPEPRPVEAAPIEKLLEPAKMSKRDEREVAERLAKLLQGVTQLASLPTEKDYLGMTDQEAKDIAEPLASYLTKNAETIPIAKEIVDNFDLGLLVLGVTAYVVRVYSDRRREVALTQSSRPTPISRRQGETSARVSEIQEETNRRQQDENQDATSSLGNDGQLNWGSVPIIPQL